MLKTIRGDDGKPYISLEDLIGEIDSTIIELKDMSNKGIENDEFTSDSIEDRIIFLKKLHESLKTIQSEYYKKILGWNE